MHKATPASCNKLIRGVDSVIWDYVPKEDVEKILAQVGGRERPDRDYRGAQKGYGR